MHDVSNKASENLTNGAKILLVKLKMRRDKIRGVLIVVHKSKALHPEKVFHKGHSLVRT